MAFKVSNKNKRYFHKAIDTSGV